MRASTGNRFIFFIFLFCVVQSMGFTSETSVASWPSSKPMAQLTAPPSANLINQETNQGTLYRTFCAHCHGIDGRSRSLVERTMPEIPDLSDESWTEYEPDDLVESIADGVGKMPAFKGILTQGEIRGLAELAIRMPKGKRDSWINRKWVFTQNDKKRTEKLQELKQQLLESLENNDLSTERQSELN